MKQNLGIYTPGDVFCIVNGRTLTGYSENTFIITERDDENEFLPRTGAQGDFTFQENLNRSGQITVTLKQNASDNTFLRSLLEGKAQFLVEIKATHNYQEIVRGTTCMIKVAPRKEFAQEESDREWVIGVGELIETDKAA